MIFERVPVLRGVPIVGDILGMAGGRGNPAYSYLLTGLYMGLQTGHGAKPMVMSLLSTQSSASSPFFVSKTAIRPWPQYLVFLMPVG